MNSLKLVQIQDKSDSLSSSRSIRDIILGKPKPSSKPKAQAPSRKFKSVKQPKLFKHKYKHVVNISQEWLNWKTTVQECKRNEDLWNVAWEEYKYPNGKPVKRSQVTTSMDEMDENPVVETPTKLLE
jgi:hypothetical protein